MSTLQRVSVVVPARDEELVLPDCLRSVDLARRVLQQSRPDLTVTVTVVLDRCVDGSAQVVARHPDVEVLEVSAGRVGVARAAGVEHSLGGVLDTSRSWLASTDADCIVPPQWLSTQVALAEGGHDLVLGTVEPQGLDAGLLAQWSQRHRLGEGHRHVHGANLGVRAATYLGVGGFRGVGLHEDVLLAEAVKATGARWLATDATRVRTSARQEGRVEGGFATYLRHLADDVSAADLVVTPALCE